MYFIINSYGYIDGGIIDFYDENFEITQNLNQAKSFKTYKEAVGYLSNVEEMEITDYIIISRDLLEKYCTISVYATE